MRLIQFAVALFLFQCALFAEEISSEPSFLEIPSEMSPLDTSSEESPLQVEEVAILKEEKSEKEESSLDESKKLQDEKRWYIGVKPGYYFFTDKEMRQFFDNGSWIVRAETGYRFWGPLTVWIDASYLQTTGHGIGGGQDLDLKLANITLGLKCIHSFNPYVTVYAGAGPRVFIMLLHNDSPYIRGDDNAVGIGGGFDAGLWVFPIPQWPNFFLDICADYSWKNLKIEPDEISSLDSDIDVSGLSSTIGIGIRF